MENGIKYVKEKQIAEIYDLAVQTLRNWRFQGKGPPYVKIGKAVRYPLGEAINYMEQHKVTIKE